jgi:hypothetical protein
VLASGSENAAAKRRERTMRIIGINRSTGTLLLGIWLVLSGLVTLLNLSFAGLVALMGLLALAAGLALLLGR